MSRVGPSDQAPFACNTPGGSKLQAQVSCGEATMSKERGGLPSRSVRRAPAAVFRLHGRNLKRSLARIEGKAPTVAASRWNFWTLRAISRMRT
jgi:hypothetical protein